MNATTHKLLAAPIGSVWVFHGLWSKVLGQIPRHELIVGRILGDTWAAPATLAIGLCEIAMGIWVFTGLFRRTCATVQTVALVSMNTLEILIARDLLIRKVVITAPRDADARKRNARSVSKRHCITQSSHHRSA